MGGTTRNPSTRRAAGASEGVIVGRRNDQKFSRTRTEKQVAEREIYDGRRHLGTVRATAAGEFVAVVEEQVLGSFATVAEATDAVIAAHRPGWRA